MSRFGLEIRAATAAEAPGIATLLAMAGHPADPRDLADRLTTLRDAPGATLVALRWGPPSGLLIMHWYPTLDDARPTAQVTTMLVNPEERRIGIGRLLLKAAAQAARSAGCSKLEMGVSADAPFLRAFCQATGFAEVGSRFVRPLRKQG